MLSALKNWRVDKAIEKECKLYHILTNKTIEEIVEKTPKSVAELYNINGIGIKKLQDFGISLLRICNPLEKYEQEWIDEFIATKQKKRSPSKIRKKQIVDTTTFSAGQQEVFDNYLEGKNILITGAAGCGKTFCIQQIVNHARNSGKKVEICAMTGCAAILLNCRAKTFHSWSGIGIREPDPNKIYKNIIKKPYKKKNWTTTQLLIIDEISMMSAYLFELLDALGRKIINHFVPFGGIQVILSGDFYQLPPIPDKGIPNTDKFCFQSKIWNDNIHKIIELKNIYRQKDKKLIKILKQVRNGKISKKSYNALMNCVSKSREFPHGVHPVIMLPIKRKVENINKKKMRELTGVINVYKYKLVLPKKKIKDERIEFETKYIVKNSPFKSTLKLTKGTQVMCISNLDLANEICNGSTGLITGFNCGIPVVKFTNGIERMIPPHTWESNNIEGFGIAQIPLIPAWAVTIHKLQGATLDRAEIDIGNDIFENGQTYVALSRLRSLKGLYITAFDPKKIRTNPIVKEFYSNLT